MKSKYLDAVKRAVDEYWRNNYRPPVIRDIQEMCGINSTSHVSELFKALPGVRVVDGHPIPDWIIQAIEKAYDQKTAHVVR